MSRRHPPEALVSDAQSLAACAALARHPGPLYCGRLHHAHWPRTRALLGAMWLAVTVTDWRSLPAYVWLCCDRPLSGLVPAAPADAARQARTWLRLRLAEEVSCCPDWPPDLPLAMAALGEHHLEAAPLPCRVTIPAERRPAG